MSENERREAHGSVENAGRSCAGFSRVVLSIALVLPGGLVPRRAVAQPTPAGIEFQVNQYTTSIQVAPSVAAASDGSFVIVWTSAGSYGSDSSYTSVQARRYDAGGMPIGDQFQVNSFTTGTSDDPIVSMASDDSFVVVWASYGQGVRGQRFLSDGSAAGGELVVDPGGLSYDVALARTPSDDFLVVWNELNDIFARLYDASGSPLGASLQVNTYTTGQQRFGRATSLSDGSFVVVWDSQGSVGTDGDGLSIQGRRLAADGSFLGGQFQANADTTGGQSEPSVAALPSDEFLVVWQGPGVSLDIFGRRFDSGGSPLGNDFVVNSTTTGSQLSPWIAADPTDDRFVVVWESTVSSGDDSSGNSVQLGALDPLGVPLFAEIQVNTYTSSSQQTPHVGFDGAGDLVVTWESNGSSGTDNLGFSVQAQRFSGPLPVELLRFRVE